MYISSYQTQVSHKTRRFARDAVRCCDLAKHTTHHCFEQVNYRMTFEAPPPRTFSFSKRTHEQQTTPPPMNLSNTWLLTKSEEVWVMSLLIPLSIDAT